eukprot:5912170-Prymnesium_polylepis.1
MANTVNMAKTGRAAKRATAMHHARAQPPTPRTRPCSKRMVVVVMVVVAAVVVVVVLVVVVRGG